MNKYTIQLQEALTDNKMPAKEVQSILRASNSDLVWNNHIIENAFAEHGYTIKLNQGYRSGLLRATKQQEIKVEGLFRRKLSLDRGTRRKLAWLLIVGSAALISLFKFLTI